MLVDTLWADGDHWWGNQLIGVTPVMWTGPMRRWRAALERLIDTGAQTFVPGHGPVCGIAEVERLAD
jgi:cyclase